MTPLHAHLAETIAATGPLPISRYMAECLSHPRYGYYVTRDPLGRAGDFTTAPEISQVFGELIGFWLADLWLRAGSPAKVHLVELGPGRGTLMADLLRASARIKGLADSIRVHFVELSPTLRVEQAKRVPNAHWHDSFGSVPDDAPLLLVANEFFDALPIRQLVRTTAGWCERMVGLDGDRLVPIVGKLPLDVLVPPTLAGAPVGSIIEMAPAGEAIIADIADRLARQGGSALVIDYGYSGPAVGDTLQAVRAHRYADPFVDPGTADLTAHVDFAALMRAAAKAGAVVHGPVSQGALLRALGIEARTTTLLARATEAQAELLRSGTERLIGADAMGELFKALALTAPNWPQPGGFAA